MQAMQHQQEELERKIKMAERRQKLEEEARLAAEEKKRRQEQEKKRQDGLVAGHPCALSTSNRAVTTNSGS